MAKRKAKTTKAKEPAPKDVRLVKDRDGTFSLRGLNADDLGTLSVLTGATVPSGKHPFIQSTNRLFKVLCGTRDNDEPGVKEWDRFYWQGMDKLVINAEGDKLIVSV